MVFLFGMLLVIVGRRNLPFAGLSRQCNMFSTPNFPHKCQTKSHPTLQMPLRNDMALTTPN